MSEFEFLRNVTIGQYLPTGSAIHQLDPRAKLFILVLLIVGAVAGTSWVGLAFLLGTLMGAVAVARIPLRYAIRGLRPAWPFLVFIALVQALSVPPTTDGRMLLRWWRVTVTTTGLVAAAATLTRFAALILEISLFSFATRTTELAHGVEHLLRPLQKIGLPAHEFALTVVVALRFIPLLALEAERIAKAQASRGADLGASKVNVFRRARRLLPLLIPLFVTSLRRAEALALAMEARCYTGGKGRTQLIQLSAGFRDAVAVAMGLLLAAVPLAATLLDLDQVVWYWLAGT